MGESCIMVCHTAPEIYKKISQKTWLDSRFIRTWSLPNMDQTVSHVVTSLNDNPFRVCASFSDSICHPVEVSFSRCSQEFISIFPCLTPFFIPFPFLSHPLPLATASSRLWWGILMKKIKTNYYYSYEILMSQSR